MTTHRACMLLLASILGALAFCFAWLNLYPVTLSIELAAMPGNVAQVFHSPSGNWNEQASAQRQQLHPVERHDFDIPVGSIGKGVRFDPAINAGTYQILSVRWQRGIMSRQIAPEMIGNLRPELQTLRIDGGSAVMTSADSDPYVFLPAPGEAWRLFALLPVLLVGLASFLAARRAWTGRLGAVGVATVFLVNCTAVYVLTAFANMPTLPLLDDWRYIVPGPILLVGDQYGWLTLVTNDTYFLTGLLLDFVALKLTNVDFASVRWVGIAVLVAFLVAQYRTVVASGAAAWAAALGVALLVGLLGQNGYWGATSLAYHQFLPVLAAAALLAYVTRPNRDVGAFGLLVVVTPLCLAAGLAYISGGLIIAGVGGGLLLAQADRSFRLRDDKVRAAWVIALLGGGTLLLQVWLVSSLQGSLIEHNHAVSSVFPNDRRFVIFCTALFGRAAGYRGTHMGIDVALSVIALLPAAILAAERLWNGLVRRIPAERPILTALPICAAAATVAYAGAVAFGRAGFVDASLAQPIVTSVAKVRFHFCTIAAFLPLLWLGWFELARRVRSEQRRRALSVVAVAAAAVLLVPKSLMSWKVADEYRATQERLAEGAYCASAALADKENRQPIICTGLSGIEADIRPALDVMQSLDADVYRTITTRYRLPPTVQSP